MGDISEQEENIIKELFEKSLDDKPTFSEEMIFKIKDEIEKAKKKVLQGN